MMLLVLIGAALAMIAVPHVVSTRDLTPATAAALWGVALGLRAVLSVFVVAYVLVVLPATAIFASITDWCWHTALPVAATNVGVMGAWVGQGATLLPALVLAVSAALVAASVLRSARRVRRLVVQEAIGRGPRGSVIVGGADVFVAVAGFSRPRLVLSTGALTQLDDAELAAGIAHEDGHIHRRHRFVVLYAEACRALARFTPGTDRALAALFFQLERDADAWALRRATDPVALASAICKAASSRTPSLALATLAGAQGISARVSGLLDQPARPPLLRQACLATLAGLGLALLIALTAQLPAVISDGRAHAALAAMRTACGM
ncbi:M56 family metallopeptidase [Patulibacter sp. NPDC049589]|uniref:M56 family metallopeptidase n=1 Tax=Patulibacter sp. NPDC049589 TaxID=3154731 RepID=UPI00341FAFE6